MSKNGMVEEFITAACSGDMKNARQLLADNPELAKASILTAAITGNVDTVRQLLEEDSSLATQKSGPRNAEPLLYLCFSRFHRESPEQAEQMLETAKILLEHGADPDAYYLSPEFDNCKLSALYGACGEGYNPPLARLLLEHGANPNDNESLYHSCEFGNDHTCLKLLLEFNVNPNGTNALKRALDFEDLEKHRLLLEHGADPNESPCCHTSETALHHAIIRGRSTQAIAQLLQYGADIEAKTLAGKTAYALAKRFGQNDVAEILKEHGASTELSPKDRFLGACASGNRVEVELLLKETPGIFDSLSIREKSLIAHAASLNNLKGVETMLAMGFDIDTKGDWGGSAAHQAAWFGHRDMMELLLRYSPSLEQQNDFGGGVLGTAVYASRHNVNWLGQYFNPDADYPGTIRLLLDAGAPVHESLFTMGSNEITEILNEHTTE